MPPVSIVGKPAPAGGPAPPVFKTASQELQFKLRQLGDDDSTRTADALRAVDDQAADRSAHASVIQANSQIHAQALQDEAQANSTARLAATHAADREVASIAARTKDAVDAKVDPGKIFHGHGTAQTIIFSVANALAQGLGGFGAAMNHTRNFAADIIQNAIDGDVQAQRDNIQNAKDSKAELLKQANERYGRSMNQVEFDHANAIAGLTYAGHQLDSQAAQFAGDDQAQSIANDTKTTLANRLSTEKQGLAEQNYQARRLDEQQLHAAATAGVNVAKEEKKEWGLAYGQAYKDIATAHPELSPADINSQASSVANVQSGRAKAEAAPFSTAAGSPKLDETAKKNLNAQQDFHSALQEYQDAYAKPGTLSRVETAKGAAVLDRLIHAQAIAETDGGARPLSPGREDEIRKQYADPNGYKPGRLIGSDPQAAYVDQQLTNVRNKIRTISPAEADKLDKAAPKQPSVGTVTRVTSPDGRTGSIPTINLAAALKDGYKVLQ